MPPSSHPPPPPSLVISSLVAESGGMAACTIAYYRLLRFSSIITPRKQTFLGSSHAPASRNAPHFSRQADVSHVGALAHGASEIVDESRHAPREMSIKATPRTPHPTDEDDDEASAVTSPVDFSSARWRSITMSAIVDAGIKIALVGRRLKSMRAAAAPPSASITYRQGEASITRRLADIACFRPVRYYENGQNDAPADTHAQDALGRRRRGASRGAQAEVAQP